tara:strand:- start:275 stop:556 length:282 start_codon:yes stop_codon:yes gene_type:complete
MTNNLLNFHLKIYGKVQGVGFRAWTKKTAESFFLTGWVKNCDDKSVECEVSGKRENIDFFVNACKKGPIFASVKKIQKKEEFFKKFKNFSIYY